MIIDLIVHLTIGLNWVTQIVGLLSTPVKMKWYQYMSNIGNGPSCPPMSKMAWSQLSTLEKLDGTCCPPWHNWMVPVVHLGQKWHGTSCPWYQLSGSLFTLMFLCVWCNFCTNVFSLFCVVLYMHNEKSFNFVGTKFYGLTTLDMFVDTWIRSFSNNLTLLKWKRTVDHFIFAWWNFCKTGSGIISWNDEFATRVSSEFIILYSNRKWGLV